MKMLKDTTTIFHSQVIKIKSAIILILLTLVLAFWFKCSTDRPEHQDPESAFLERQTETRKTVVIDPTEKMNHEEGKSTHEFDFAIEEDPVNLEFEPLLGGKPTRSRIKPLKVVASSAPKIETLKPVEKIAVFKLSEVQNLEIFATREFGKSDEQLLQQILGEVITWGNIDLLLCMDYYAENSNPVVMWYSPEMDITDIVKQEFLNRVK